ncbi:MAG: tRNA (adenosine(37)-N6)-threonylcarbamoyltransferase complex dimerization subunit type 1 TsaB [Betaproteobacteria bacterium]
MKILAFDTSSEWCSVALQRDGQVCSRETHAGQRHSELIIAMIDALLMESGVRVADLEAIAFGAGPGSFTGLRIACGIAQGLAFGADLPVACVSTLLAVAEATQAQRVIVALDARMSELYYAAYERTNDRWRTVHAPRLCVPTATPEVEGGGWIGAGTGFAVHADALAQHYAGQVIGTRPELHPSARAVASLGAQMVRDGLAVPADDAQPLYLRDRVALTIVERQALKAQKTNAPAGNS